MNSLVLIIILLIGYTAQAIEMDWQKEPISIENDWDSFLLSFQFHMLYPEDFLSPGSGMVPAEHSYLKIVPIKEIPNTLVIGFNYPFAMNMAFLRASVFVEKLTFKTNRAPIWIDGFPLLRDVEFVEAAMDIGALGHDLRARDLLNFWKIMDQVDKQDLGPRPIEPFDKFIDVEAKVRSILEPYFQQHPETALVIFAINGYSSGIVTHELSHAQYFNNPDYQRAVLDYWHNKMTHEQREQARVELDLGKGGGFSYGRDLEDLMINEFQAYLTSINFFSWPILEKLHDPHHALLKAHLMNSLPNSRLIQLPHPKKFYEYRLSVCSKYLLAN